MSATATRASLQAHDVCMSFGGVVALDKAAIEVEPGGVIGLIGRNGSGKSTLFNCITGFLSPTSGSIRIDGRDITGHPPQEIVRAGVARTFQTPRVDHRVTAREAVLCGLFRTARSGLVSSMLGLGSARREERRLNEVAESVLQRLSITDWAAEEIGRLSMGRVRLVEVARAVAAGARYLLLDEPAAGLSGEEQQVLAREIRKLAADGVGVLLVEHNFSLIRMLCDRVTVLDSGRVLATGTPDEVERDELVVAMYLGAAR